MTTERTDWIVHDEHRMHLPELSDHCVSCLTAEVEALRSVLCKTQKSVGWWAALSFISGAHGKPSRWTVEEQQLLRRAGLTD